MRYACRYLARAASAESVGRCKADMVDTAVTGHIRIATTFRANFGNGCANTLAIRRERAVAEGIYRLIVIGSPSGSVTPSTSTGTNMWFGGQSVSMLG